MAREKKARKSNGSVVTTPVAEKLSTPEKIVEEEMEEVPESNGKKHMNGVMRNGKQRISESEKPLGDREKESTTPTSETKKAKTGGAAGGSQCVLLTQGIMANDATKIDAVIKIMNSEIIHATLRDLQPMQVLPLLKIIESRLKTRNAVDIRPTIRWAQVAFSLHMPFLCSLPNLEKEIGGLIGWLRSRVGHHKELLALHGKISTIADLIKRRTNNVVIVQQPLVVFNNDLDSDSEDFDTIASDDEGDSSEDDWWEDNELKDEDGDNQDEDDEDGDNGSDDSEMDADSGDDSDDDDNEGGSSGDGSDANDDNEDMEVG